MPIVSTITKSYFLLPQLISLNAEVEDEELSEDFDATLKSYTKSLQQEISVADAVSRNDL